MASVSFQVDTSGIGAMNAAVARMIGQYEWIAARSMTNAAKAAKVKLKATILPQIKGGATSWTSRGLMSSFAKPNRLTSNVGWNYGDGAFADSGFTPKSMGVPSGRYMGLLAGGGDRKAKSSELQLRRAGVIRSDQFITPASKGVRLNRYGNLPGPQYQQILSRVKAASGPGYTSSASGSSRSRSRRAQSDYFAMPGELGDGVRFIARRVGKRGFIPALFVVDQPNYERKFDIRSVALREYSRVFPVEFEKGLQAELRRRAK